ncbi:MAG: 3-keto-5-aminohexanoate cleavage protein [Myxococcota bacterium]
MPGIPYTPVEIAEEAKRAYDAGASVVHIHARNDDGTATFSENVFRQINDEIRKRCPLILNFSTGKLDDDTSEAEAYIRSVQPEIAALNMGTMNYAYSEAAWGFRV